MNRHIYCYYYCSVLLLLLLLVSLFTKRKPKNKVLIHTFINKHRHIFNGTYFTHALWLCMLAFMHSGSFNVKHTNTNAWRRNKSISFINFSVLLLLFLLLLLIFRPSFARDKQMRKKRNARFFFLAVVVVVVKMIFISCDAFNRHTMTMIAYIVLCCVVLLWFCFYISNYSESFCKWTGK